MYMPPPQLEAFGMSYARAVEVALKMQKVQFAKTLVGKQAQAERLREKVGGRNLLCCMAHECQAGSDPEIQVISALIGTWHSARSPTVVNKTVTLTT